MTRTALGTSTIVAMTMALGGCGHLQSPTRPALPPVSILDVPQLKTAQYVAVVEHAPPLSVAMSLDLERGAYHCARALADLDRTQRAEDPACPNVIVDVLRAAPSHALVVIDEKGTHTVTDKDLAAFVGGIDLPQKALLAAFLHGCGLGWVGENGEAGGGSATAGFVKPVPTGYEVLGGRLENQVLGDASCGESSADGDNKLVKQIERSYQIAWQVDHAGNITIGERRLLSEKKGSHFLDCHMR